MMTETSGRARRGRPAMCESDDPVLRLTGQLQTLIGMATTMRAIRSMPLGSVRVEQMLATLGRALTALEADMGMGAATGTGAETKRRGGGSKGRA